MNTARMRATGIVKARKSHNHNVITHNKKEYYTQYHLVLVEGNVCIGKREMACLECCLLASLFLVNSPEGSQRRPKQFFFCMPRLSAAPAQPDHGAVTKNKRLVAAAAADGGRK